jgi:hypothetical protein
VKKHDRRDRQSKASSLPCFGRRSSGLKLNFPLVIITTAAALAVGAGHTAAQSAGSPPRQISATAALQIQMLMQEKRSRTPSQRKIHSGLLMSIKRQRSDALFNALPTLRTSGFVNRDGTALVDITADVDDALIEAIEAAGGSIVNSHPRFRAVRATVPLDAVEGIAARPEVTNIRAADRAITNKVDTSEGDVSHAADSARTSYGVDGTGVKIGVLSDSVDSLAALQASGDLPMTVTVLPGQDGVPGSSEGTAMLEIVHDLAPGADLYFATAFGGFAQFAQNILDLQVAGCQVIVDDVFYFAEGVFQDDTIAAAVDTVKAAGVQYYSSAGNSGNLNDSTSGVWEGDFSSTTTPAPLVGSGTAADFGGGDSGNGITADSSSYFTLHWSDPIGASGNDYDLYLLNPTLTTVLDASTDTQDGDDRPYEQIDTTTFDDTDNVLVVLKFSGVDRMLHLNANRGRLEHGTAGQTSGHGAARGAFGVAAVDWWETQTGGSPNPFDGTEPVETFSSDGPRRVHYESNGTPITPGDFSSTGGELRQKPDITAADGVSTATPGFNPFFGTSAAAPHAAAIGALMLEANPTLTPDGVRAIFESTALDIETPGVDRDSGVGIVMADTAVGAAAGLIFADGFESGDTSAWSSTAGGA